MFVFVGEAILKKMASTKPTVGEGARYLVRLHGTCANKRGDQAICLLSKGDAVGQNPVLSSRGLLMYFYHCRTTSWIDPWCACSRLAHYY